MSDTDVIAKPKYSLDPWVIGFGFAMSFALVPLLFQNEPFFRSWYRAPGPVLAKMTSAEGARIRVRGDWQWQPGKVNFAELRNGDSVLLDTGAKAKITVVGKSTKELIGSTEFVLDTVTIENWDLPSLSQPSPEIRSKELVTTVPVPGELQRLSAQFTALHTKWTEWSHDYHLETIKPLKKRAILATGVDFFDIRLVKPLNEKQNLRYFPWLELVWTEIPVPGVRYEVEFAKEPEFVSVIKRETFTVARGKVQILEPGEFFWRVLATKGKEKTVSDSGRFSVLLRDEVNARSPTTVSKTKTYLAEIATDSNFKTVANQVPVDRPDCPKDGLFKGQYFCRVLHAATRKTVRTYRMDVP